MLDTEIHVEATEIRLGDMFPGQTFIKKDVDKDTIFLIIDRTKSGALEVMKGGQVVTVVDLSRAMCINFQPDQMVTQVYQMGPIRFSTVL